MSTFWRAVRVVATVVAAILTIAAVMVLVGHAPGDPTPWKAAAIILFVAAGLAALAGIAWATSLTMGDRR